MNPPFLTKNRPKESYLQDEGAGSNVTKVTKDAAFFASARGRRKQFGVGQGGAGSKILGAGRGNC